LGHSTTAKKILLKGFEVSMSAISHCGRLRHHTLFLLRGGKRSMYVQGKAPF